VRAVRGLTGIVVATLLGLAVVVGATAAADDSDFDGSWTEHHYDAEVALDSRDYFVYVPAELPEGDVPLVVYLHGCNQTAYEAALGVRWNELADTEGFIVAYPQQFDPNTMAPGPDQGEAYLFGGNGGQCWNWFRPEHIERGLGEAATIAGITRTVMADHAIDEDRVYLAGISAGGVMASTMGATYPDIYAAVSVLAGCGYLACADVDGSAAVAAMGEHARPLPVVVVHGTADTVAPFPMGMDAVAQWLATNDLIDDGQANGSVASTPATSRDVGMDASALGGLGTLGDVCVRSWNVPCLGGLLGMPEYPHTIDTYLDAAGCELVQFWTLHGLQHSYSGGDPRGTFTDPLGPGETPVSWAFFQRHTRSGPTEAACAG